MSKDIKNIFIFITAVIFPFFIVALDYTLIKKQSALVVMSKALDLPEGFGRFLGLPILFLYFLSASVVLLNFLEVSKKAKLITSVIFIIVMMPLTLGLYLFIGMGVYNVYP